MAEATQLTGAQKRFIGHSGDTKPFIGDESGKHLKPNDLPVGSSFFETDTGRMFRWEDENWKYAPELTQALTYQVLERIEGQLARTNDLLEQLLAHIT